MLKHKSLHPYGLDFLIFNNLKSLSCVSQYYLYVYDYCCALKPITKDFFDRECNKTNTWNYNLKFEDTAKDAIMKNNITFGLGDINYDDQDEFIIVKGRNHFDSSLKNGQSHKVRRAVFESDYDREHFVGQKILKSSDTNVCEELNVFVVRNLKTREINFFCIMCSYDTNININRKYTNSEMKEVKIEVLGDKKENFINFMNHINLDYGRVELIKDKNKGWCVIDINNSPGNGPTTRKFYNNVANLFAKCME